MSAPALERKRIVVMRDRIVNQHNPGIALYPRSLSYDLLPLIGPPGWALLRALHDHADEQAQLYRGSRPIAPTSEEMQALAGVGEASLQIIKDLLRVCGCLSWEEMRGKQQARPGRNLKQAPTRSFVYYLHPLTGLVVSSDLVQRVLEYAIASDRAQAYLKANGLLRPRPAFLPTSAWPPLAGWLVENPTWQALYQRAHGKGAHHGYRAETARWLAASAEVVATLESEQYPSAGAVITLADRAVMVMARWQQGTTVPSWGGHGPLTQNHGDSALSPHTPLNELTNQSINQETGSGRASGKDGRKEGKSTKSAGNSRASQANQEQPIRSARQAHLQADAGADQLAQAEAALWAAIPDVLDAADAGPAQGVFAQLGGAMAVYQPTRGEQRQARRLLRDNPVERVVAALRRAVDCFQPTPGQPTGIARFGFAVGLPEFQAALTTAASDEAAEAVGVGTEQVHSDAEHAQDFWHEYRRVNGRAASRAEHRRIEALAGITSWLQLLVWLDRWEQAHSGDGKELSAGYFESCIAAEHIVTRQESQTSPVVATAQGQPASLPQQYSHVLARLRELGIRRAEALAQRPGTTLALVDAWWTASERQGVKDRHAYTAAGIASGHLPEHLPAMRATAVSSGHAANDQPDLRVPTDASYEGVWQRVLASLALQVSTEAFTTWLAVLRLLDIIEQTAIITAPNVFVRNEARERFDTLIADALRIELGHIREIEIVIDTPGS